MVGWAKKQYTRDDEPTISCINQEKNDKNIDNEIYYVCIEPAYNIYITYITFVNYFILRFSIAYIGPSLTTYQNLNPGYRIYTADGNYDESTYVSIPSFASDYFTENISLYGHMFDQSIIVRGIWQYKLSLSYLKEHLK